MDITPEHVFLPTLVTPPSLAEHMNIPLKDAEALFRSGEFPYRKLPTGQLVASKFSILRWLERD